METSKTPEQSLNERAEEATAQLRAVAENLEGLILHSDEEASMRLQAAAQQIGRIAKSADGFMQSEYGID